MTRRKIALLLPKGWRRCRMPAEVRPPLPPHADAAMSATWYGCRPTANDEPDGLRTIDRFC